MRRKDREITDPGKIHEIISRCHCCRVGLIDGGQVYIVPLNFGFRHSEPGGTFYFHGAKEGRKIDLIRQSPQVGFELDTNFRLNEAEIPCGYSARFQSVIGTGRASIVADPDEKERGLRAIMAHHTGREDWSFDSRMLSSVCVFKIEVTEMSCKEHL